jgi:MGT family glycosyltransferase
MARFLFVVPPLTGHVNPTVAVAAELERRGHEVAWTGIQGETEAMLPVGATFFAATSDEVAAVSRERHNRDPNMRGAAAYKYLQEEVLAPMAKHTVDGIDVAVDSWGADVLVVDQQAFGGAIVGRRRALQSRPIPWATSATTSAELIDPLSGLPKVSAAMHQVRVDLQVSHGIPVEVAEQGDLRVSPHLVLAYTSPALVADQLTADAAAAPISWVGPVTLGRTEADDFDWGLLDPTTPTVLVSLGTLNATAGEKFWQVASEAFRDQPWQGIFVAPPELVPDAPDNVVVRSRIPQLSVLRRADVVVSHGGHNTVCETLAAGIPLVLAPIRDDQPVVADQVVRAGAGVRVKFARVKPADLQGAITQALEDPDLRSAAGRLSADFASYGGTPAAASALEALLA